MTSSFFIKVYFTKQNQQQPEIRRFAVRNLTVFEIVFLNVESSR